MAKVTTSNVTERNWLVNVGSAYSLMFDEVSVTAPVGGWKSGSVLSDATSLVGLADTATLGILADDMAAGTAVVRVLTRGICSVREDGLIFGATADATAKGLSFAALEARLITKAE